MKIAKKILFLLIILFSYSFVSAKTVNIYLFHNKDCTHCQSEIKYLDTLKEKYDIKVYKYEVSRNKDNEELLRKVRKIFNNDDNLVPFTIIGNETLSGFNTINEGKILKLIEDYDSTDYCDKLGVYLGKVEESENCKNPTKNEENIMDLPLIGEVDVKSFSLPIISLIIGLVDGFNPCAMWVLIFLLSMLIGMKNRKKMWILGLTFILTSALVYLFIMVAWLNIVASFTTVRWIQLIIAFVALTAGIINMINYFKSLKQENGCSVTDASSKKKIINKIKNIVKLEEKSENKQKFAFLLAVLGIMALAISVNVIELACSAGLPLIFTQILAMNDISTFARIIYIGIYILFFMIDDIIVFIIAMVTFKITGISTKYTKYSHLIGGIIMLLIGLLMIFKPEWIMFNF